jgi:hypothetical protein
VVGAPHLFPDLEFATVPRCQARTQPPRTHKQKPKLRNVSGIDGRNAEVKTVPMYKVPCAIRGARAHALLLQALLYRPFDHKIRHDQSIVYVGHRADCQRLARSGLVGQNNNAADCNQGRCIFHRSQGLSDAICVS